MGTYTPNMVLYKPAVSERDWGALVNANFDILDAMCPTWACLWHGDSVAIVGNALTFVFDAAQEYGFYWYQGTPSLGDSVYQRIFLAAGDYTLYAYGITDIDGGVLSWSLDSDVIETNQEWYSATQVKSVVQTFDFSCAESGEHTLSTEVTGQNVSSTGYNIPLGRIIIRPQGA